MIFFYLKILMLLIGCAICTFHIFHDFSMYHRLAGYPQLMSSANVSYTVQKMHPILLPRRRHFVLQPCLLLFEPVLLLGLVFLLEL